MNNKILFIENGHNTSYINSLLVGLFYNPSIIHTKLLDTDPTNIYFIYLQEMIKNNFVDPLRKGTSITADVTNEIRNFCFFSGFSKNITKKHNIFRYFDFIMNNISPIYNEKSRRIISLDNSIEDTNIKTLLNSETLQNLPNNMHDMYMIPIYIDRYTYGSKLNTKIDIKRKIMLKNSNFRWNIHCVICHNGTNLDNGSYYTIIPSNNKWIVFDDAYIPSFRELDMGNMLMIDKIMRECVLLIYRII